MDERRLSTGDILNAGMLGVPAPTTEIPKDRETFHAGGDEYVGRDAVLAALEEGKVVESPNYYGIPHIWKAGDGVYRGTLLQYRAVSEDPTFATAEEAEAWFSATNSATIG